MKIEPLTKKNLSLAGAEGLEPPTVGFGDRCSTNSNYTPVATLQIKKYLHRPCEVVGLLGYVSVIREGRVLYLWSSRLQVKCYGISNLTGYGIQIQGIQVSIQRALAIESAVG